jgi:hypothetical protein
MGINQSSLRDEVLVGHLKQALKCLPKIRRRYAAVDSKLRVMSFLTDFFIASGSFTESYA